MAEVHRPSSTEDEGGQQVIGNTYSGRNPVMSSAPGGGTLFRGPETYPAQMRVLDGIPMEEVECLEPLSISVLDAPLDSRPMAGNRMRNSPDVVIYEKNTTGRPMEGVTSPTPWRRSVTLLHLDSQPSGYKSMPDQSKDPISEDIPQRQEKPPDSKIVSYKNTDKAVRRAPSGLTKDPLSLSHLEPLVWNPVSEVVLLGHIVGRTGLACDPAKLTAVQNWHAPDKVKGVRQFVGFVGYYRRFVKDFAELAEPLVTLTRKGVPFVWTDKQQTTFETLKACLVRTPILGFPTEDGRFVLDTDASLFAVGGMLSQLQKEGEVVIANTSRSLRLSQRRYCTPRREMLAAVVMCTHFRSYLRGEQFTLGTDHSSLRWLQRFRNGDGMLACWYLLLGHFSVTFEFRPGAQHANADSMSRQCGQCQRPDCPVSAIDSPTPENNKEMEMVDQPFAASEIGESMGADLLPELSGETWAASALTEEFTADLPAGNTIDLIAESNSD